MSRYTILCRDNKYTHVRIRANGCATAFRVGSYTHTHTHTLDPSGGFLWKSFMQNKPTLAERINTDNTLQMDPHKHHMTTQQETHQHTLKTATQQTNQSSDAAALSLSVAPPPPLPLVWIFPPSSTSSPRFCLCLCLCLRQLSGVGGPSPQIPSNRLTPRQEPTTRGQ